MENNYKCKFMKSIITEEYEEECEENIHFIFEFQNDSANLKSVTNNIFAPKFLTPMEFEGLEFLGKVDESYGVIASNYPLIEIVSNSEFRLVTARDSINGKITKEDLESCGFSSLYDLVNSDFELDVLFINDAPLVAKKVVILSPISAILPK